MDPAPSCSTPPVGTGWVATTTLADPLEHWLNVDTGETCTTKRDATVHLDDGAPL